MLTMVCWAMNANAQAQAADSKSSPEIYETIYLTNLTQQNDANELLTDLRNMLPGAKTIRAVAKRHLYPSLCRRHRARAEDAIRPGQDQEDLSPHLHHDGEG